MGTFDPWDARSCTLSCSDLLLNLWILINIELYQILVSLPRSPSMRSLLGKGIVAILDMMLHCANWAGFLVQRRSC